MDLNMHFDKIVSLKEVITLCNYFTSPSGRTINKSN